MTTTLGTKRAHNTKGPVFKGKFRNQTKGEWGAPKKRSPRQFGKLSGGKWGSRLWARKQLNEPKKLTEKLQNNRRR